MKLIDTRIRKEQSESRSEYFPEYCVEWNTWWGKVKQEWYGVGEYSTHGFGEAYMRMKVAARDKLRTLEGAQMIIDLALQKNREQQEHLNHEINKEVSYVKYP